MSQIIDIHSRVGQGREESRSIDDALREMDAAGIARAWICPPDAAIAVRNREGNDLIAAAVAAHPDRFIGCAVANPWHGPNALDELRRAFDRGLRALLLHPPLQGFQLSDPIADPLVAVAREHTAPVYAHTGTPICSEPFQLLALARRHPRVNFIMGHMGFADFWYDAPHAAQAAPNILLETSFIDDSIILDALERVGPTRILFGSASPLSIPAVELEKITSLPIPPDDLQKILHLNAEGLLP